jgi:hypothetical protein
MSHIFFLVPNGSTEADPVNPAIAGEHLQSFFQTWKKD